MSYKIIFREQYSQTPLNELNLKAASSVSICKIINIYYAKAEFVKFEGVHILYKKPTMTPYLFTHYLPSPQWRRESGKIVNLVG